MTQATSVPVEDITVRTGAYDTHLLRAGAAVGSPRARLAISTLVSAVTV